MKLLKYEISALALLFFILLALPVAGQPRANDQPPTFSSEQLAQMLAPIALYPDPLLSQILMASTYPIEVIEADRWVKKNPGLKGGSLDDALQAMDWDPSVKALCHFPTVLAMMSERIGEITNLGNAVLAQEDDVMAMIQELRNRAYAQGNLKSSPEQKVILEKKTIIIEPANPQIIYLPYYDPLYMYGPWWYPAYPPYYWGPVGVSIGVGFYYWPGLYFSFAFGDWCYFDWPHHYIYIDVHKRPHYVRRDRWGTRSGRWTHIPLHRRGVAYRDTYTARKFGQYRTRTRTLDRNVRGYPEHQEINRERLERDLRTRERQTTVNRPRRQAEQPRQFQPQAEQQRQQFRPRVEERNQTRQQAEQPRQLRPQTRQQEQQFRPRIEERTKVRQQQVEQQRAVPRQPDRNVFNRVEEGNMERQSSERGNWSRQEENRSSNFGNRRGGGGHEQNRGFGGGGHENRGFRHR